MVLLGVPTTYIKWWSQSGDQCSTTYGDHHVVVKGVQHTLITTGDQTGVMHGGHQVVVLTKIKQ